MWRACKAMLVLIVGDTGVAQIVFISHRWLRPDINPSKAHPDDAAGTKHKLICDGMEKLAEDKGWDLERVYLWVDFAGALGPVFGVKGFRVRDC